MKKNVKHLQLEIEEHTERNTSFHSERKLQSIASNEQFKKESVVPRAVYTTLRTLYFTDNMYKIICTQIIIGKHEFPAEQGRDEGHRAITCLPYANLAV